ncbi:hypothetical protein PYCC9005_005133 [Savitreella phatthalungensis]
MLLTASALCLLLKSTAALWTPSLPPLWPQDETEMPPDDWEKPPSHPLNISIRMDVLKQFAPVVYLHPDEKYLPADPARSYERYYNATADTLSVPDSALGGMPLRDGKFVDAPVSSQARVLEDGRIVLQYWYYHYYNGPQGFKTVDSRGKVTRFPWYPLAVHFADWEHTTVVLKGEHDLQIDSVYYTVHGDINEPTLDYQVENVTHPLVYSHNNSHAGYPSPADMQNTDPAFDGFINTAVKVITLGAITHVEVGDIGFAHLPESSWIRWSDYEIYDITEAPEGVGPEWSLWKGHWGPAFDQSRVAVPPEDVPWRIFFFDFLQMLYLAGRLTKFVVDAKPSPRGPLMHYTFATFDVFPAPERSVPQDPNAHKPGLLSIIAFVYFILGFIGIVLAIVSLIFVLLFVALRAGFRRARAAYVDKANRRSQTTMSERDPLLGGR